MSKIRIELDEAQFAEIICGLAAKQALEPWEERLLNQLIEKNIAQETRKAYTAMMQTSDPEAKEFYKEIYLRWKQKAQKSYLLEIKQELKKLLKEEK